MKVTFQGDSKSIHLDIAGDCHAEKVLLTHLQEGPRRRCRFQFPHLAFGARLPRRRSHRSRQTA